MTAPAEVVGDVAAVTDVAGEATASDPTLDGRVPERRRRFGIQPRLLLMLLVTSIVSALIAGFVGYRSGTSALRDSAFDRLVEVRTSKAREMQLLFRTLENSLVTTTRGQSSVEAAEAFTAAFGDLDDAEITAAEEESLQRHYDDVIMPAVERRGRFVPDTPVELPDSAAARYLQAQYTAPFETPAEASVVDDAGDGSAWSAAHRRFHPFFLELTRRFEYNDAILLDADGNVVYSTFKRMDLGTNVLDGPFAGTALSRVYEQALESNAVDFVALSDFERYQATYGQPQAFAASPIAVDGDIVGVLAVLLPVDSINAIMTADGEWEEQGLGDTGETYLAGPDRLMRSYSRVVIEDPDEYYEQAIASGLDEDAAAFARTVGGTIFFQTVDTEAVERAVRGETGEVVADEYLGREALVAYAPLDIEGLPWVIVAKLDTSEAFEPTRNFAVQLGVATGLIVLAVCLASWFLAQIFVRPVRRLVTSVRAVAGGDLDARVDARTNDEFGDLGVAFNDMARSLGTKQELLDQQHGENERLLRSLMPERIAQRYRDGGETIVEDNHDAAVLFAEVTGLEEHARGAASGEGLAMLNELVRAFDDAAEEAGVERVGAVRSSYLATSGLVEDREDAVRRIVTLAEAISASVTDVGHRRGADIGVRVAIGYGVVSSGLVGRSTLVYDVWGDTVDAARRAATQQREPGIYVIGPAREALDGQRRLEPIDASTDAADADTVWRLIPDAS